jgi:Tol biopolymer transport system component
MTTPREPDSLLSAYLADGIDVLPDRVVDAVLDEAHRTRQRVVFGPRRTPVMNSTVKVILAAAAVIAVAVVGVGVALRTPSNPSVGSGPSAPPSASPASSPTASSSPTLAPISLTGQIAFERTVDGNTDLYMMNLDRTGLVRLTDDPATDHHATWTPDGKTLIFSRETASDPESSDIYALDIESGVETRLTDEPGRSAEPRVSPDGTLIAFDQAPAEPGLHVMDIDGSNKRFVLRFPADLDSLIGWSTDGASLYYVHDGQDILRVDVDGGDPIPVVVDGDHANVSVSADGSTFAFQSDRPPGGNFLMDVDGSNVRHVTGSWTEGFYVNWAPAGDRLVYFEPSGWLYLVRTDGSEPTRWTEGVGPAWRP